MEEYALAYEIIAQMFYRDTGFMAPGKSVPMAIAMEQPYEKRKEEFDKWSKANKSHIDAVNYILID